MNPEGSVTHWIALLQSGDDDAVRSLWERYFRGLVELARKRLCGSALVGEDEQIALSAFDSFCRGARAGRFPDLSGRDNLWGLLLTITTRKVADLVQHERRKKRHPKEGRIVNQSQEEADIEQVLGREPSPEAAAEMAEEFDRLLASLHKPDLQAVALWKLEGFTNEEIAARLGRKTRTVERKLEEIRHIWEWRSDHDA
ncbi:MAG TPA: ECF-type sigma factor [Gemmataceae bacterium]|nr:ECF-type sigma factor [Gemmataceae bacterium]